MQMHPYFREGRLCAVCQGYENTYTIREETLPAVGHGCGVTYTLSRRRIVFLHAICHGYGYTHAILKLP